MPKPVKKLLFFIVLFSIITSCSLDDNASDEFFFEYVPIESVEMPAVFTFGETYSIRYSYFRPTACHSFRDLYYDIDGNVRTVAVINMVLNAGEATCVELTDDLITRGFNFVVNSRDTYLFRYWQGTNDAGEDVYLEIEVPVTN